MFWRRLSLPWGGLVTTAAGALGLVRALAGTPTDFLPSALLVEATYDQTDELSGGLVSGVLEWPHCAWGLGVEPRGDKVPHFSPAEASPTSFGHTGASGCLAWCDQKVRVAWAMLGCRTFESWWQSWSAIGTALLVPICGRREGEQLSLSSAPIRPANDASASTASRSGGTIRERNVNVTKGASHERSWYSEVRPTNCPTNP